MRTQLTLLSVLWLLGGCAAGSMQGSATGDGSDAGAATDARGVTPDASTTGDGGSTLSLDCDPPDVLVVLDRTSSMARNALSAEGLHEPKWTVAVRAVESLTATLGNSVRAGLELFPQDPGDGSCASLDDREAGTTATNPMCQQGEVLVPPDLDTVTAIADSIDARTTPLCNSTPISAALVVARDEVDAMHASEVANNVSSREQYLVLVTDGRDTCDRAPVQQLQTVDELAAEGVLTFVIGFNGLDVVGGTDSVDPPALNDLACAGHASTNFPAGCTADADGHYRATNPTGDAVYLNAASEEDLNSALQSIAGQVCCNCVY